MTKLNVFFAIFFSQIVFGQKTEMNLKGRIVDNTNVGIENVMIMAVRAKDSLLLKYSRTDISGNFKLNGFHVDNFPNYNCKKRFQ